MRRWRKLRDGGPATMAQLQWLAPFSAVVALDKYDNLYIAGRPSISGCVTVSGLPMESLIAPLPGNGVGGYSGDGGPATRCICASCYLSIGPDEAFT